MVYSEFLLYTTSNICNRFERYFDWSINKSTVSHILRKFNEDPDLLLVTETTQKSNKRKRDVIRIELEYALLEGLLQYEKDTLTTGELHWEKVR